MSGRSVVAMDAWDFIPSLQDESVELLILDPPYYGIVAEEWDNQWVSEELYVHWMHGLIRLAWDKLTPTGSLLLFGGVGKHGSHPFWQLCMKLESFLFYRNMVTWKKRRAYGKSHDYLFCREELAWFSKSEERTKVTFNVPLLSEKRGYDGFNKDYPAKSEYKRVSNVWDDIPELMRTTRSCEKPVELYNRLVETHSNPGDLIVDFFQGTGNSGVSAVTLGRRFLGCDKDAETVEIANRKIRAVFSANPGISK